VGFLVEFDAKNDLLGVTLEGRVTDAILRDCYATAARYVTSRGPCRGIWDESGVTKFEVSSDLIPRLAKTPPIIPPGYMRVIVAPQDSLYGMMRKYQMLGQESRPDLQVVRSMGEACSLLRVESPEFGPVSLKSSPQLRSHPEPSLSSWNQQKQVANSTRRRRVALDPFLGESAAIKRLAETAAKVANSHSTVLIQGETGTGKGVLATWLHENGPRSDESFVDLNCAGLTREFLESELFGHEKGAFTGAVNQKQGLLEVGHCGTIFLDEVGDVDPNVQSKLLKVLEEKKFRRMGDVRDRFIDVRLIAATHQDLRHLIEMKVFRSDLYFRISTVPLTIPPLRERQDDIPAVAHSLLLRICSDMARPGAELSAKAVEQLRSYYWPGNIRELRNVLERALLFTDRPVLEPGDLAFETSPVHRSDAYKSDWTLEGLERLLISAALSEENQNVEKTARRLGIAKSTLYRKLKALHLT